VSDVSPVTKTKPETRWNLLGCPKTRTDLSRYSETKFAILRGRLEEILLFNNFSNCGYIPELRRYSPTKLCDGAQMANFWQLFCVLYFQLASCSSFQTCILNSHYGHTMCGSMPDIQSATAENRRRRKRKKKKGRKKEETTGRKYNGLPYSIGQSV